MRRKPVRRGRGLVLAGGVLLCLSLLFFMLLPGGKARADGFNFVCSTKAPAGGGPPPPPDPVTDGGAKVFSGINITTEVRLPSGTTSLPGFTIDPVTLEKVFTKTFDPTQANNLTMNVIGTGTIPGLDTSGDEFSWHIQPRVKSSLGPGMSQNMTELFNQNWAVPDDLGQDVTVAGLDLTVFANPAMANIVGGVKAKATLGINWKLSNKTSEDTLVGVELDSKTAGHQIPKRSDITVAFKQLPGAVTPKTYWVIGQRYEDFGFASPPATNQFGVAANVTVDDLIMGAGGSFTTTPVVQLTEKFSAAPRGISAGIEDICAPWDPQFRSSAHAAWNLDGLPSPSGVTMDILVRSGIGKGLPIDTDPVPGPLTKADETTLDAQLTGLPKRMDFILHPDSMSLTRSLEVTPNVLLRKFDMATDDPATTEDLPMHVQGLITQLPRHIFAQATFPAAGGLFTQAELTSWRLNCPGEPAPGGTQAPADVARNDITDTLPRFPVGCTRFSLAPIPSAEVQIQNHLPQDLLAQAAFGDISPVPTSANQYLYYGTRKTHTLSTGATKDDLFRYGGKLNGLERVKFDSTGAPAGGTSVKIYGQRTPPAGDDSLRAVVDTDSRTNLTDEVASTGNRITTAVTVPDFPDRVRLDYVGEKQPDPGATAAPFDVTWRASDGITLADGVLDLQFAGNPAKPAAGSMRVHGQYETGNVGNGLPPSGKIRLEETTPRVTPPPVVNEATRLRYVAAGAVADTFPTPTVPVFDANATTRIHAGAIITTRGDRTAGIETRGHADINVPQGVNVLWASVPDDPATLLVDESALAEVTAELCVPGSPSCANTKLDVTARRGPPAGDPNLLIAPPLPPIPAATTAAVEPFTAFRPGSGVQAQIIDSDLWGVDGLVTGVAKFSYKANPTDLTLVMGSTTPQPFKVNLLDATGTSEDSNHVNRPQILFANAGLDRLPQQMRLKINENTLIDSVEPWVWLNTENVNFDSITQANLDTFDPPGSRPVLTGVVRLGDLAFLTSNIPVSGRSSGAQAPYPNPRTTNGADLWAHVVSDEGRFAVDGRLQLDVPRHVAIWQPTLANCKVDNADAKACQSRPLYEMDETDTVQLKARTTSNALGDLNADAHLISGTDVDFRIKARIGTVPGHLDAGVDIVKNRRLPWTSINVGMDANVALGSIIAEVFDLGSTKGRPNATCYRRDGGGPVAGSTKSHPCDDPTQPWLDPDYTSNYGLNLQNVPAHLHVNSRIVALEERLTPGAADPGKIQTDSGGLGFVHASLDIKSTDNTIALDVGQLSGGALSAVMRATSPISGFINARMDHITIGGEDGNDPSILLDNLKYVVGAGFVVGLIFGAGWGLAVFGLGLIDALALLEGHLEFNPDIDFDMPVFVGFDNVTGIRLGVRGSTVSLDERHGAGGGDPMIFGARQRSLPHEAAFEQDGVFYHHRHKEAGTDRYWGWSSAADDIPDDFVNPNDTNVFRDIGIYNWNTCKAGRQQEDPNCYHDNDRTNLATVADFPSASRGGADENGGAFTSSDMMFDPLLLESERADIDSDEAGVSIPLVTDTVDLGVEFYKTLAEQALAFTNEEFTVPDVHDATIRSHTDSLTADLDLTLGQIQVGQTTIDTSSIDAVCQDPGVPGTDTAQAADGTLYRTILLCQQHEERLSHDVFTPSTLLSGLALNAVLPNDGNADAGASQFLRWNVVLPTPLGMDSAGDNTCETGFSNFTFDIGDGHTIDAPAASVHCTVDTQIEPQTDGSVRVTSTTTRTVTSRFIFQADPFFFGSAVSPPTVLGSVSAWLDASGHPGGSNAESAAEVTSFDPAVTLSTDPGGLITIDPCTIDANICGDLDGDNSYQIVFGDGVLSTRDDPDNERRLVTAPEAHQYPVTQDGPTSYTGILVQYAPPADPAHEKRGEMVSRTYFKVTATAKP